MRNRTTQFCGFSLVELLAAMAVMSVLMIVLVQAVGAVSKTWKLGAARVDNLAQARAVLGLIDRDVQSIVLRPDLAAFVDENGNPACAFYSRVLGGDGDRRLSLVRYSGNGSAGLNRSDYGLDYGNRVLTLNETTKLPDLVKPEMVTEKFADGVLRFECQYMTADGTLQDQFHFDFKKLDAISNTRTMIVSLLVLDNAAYSLAQQTDTMPTLLAHFAGPPQEGKTYADAWKGQAAIMPRNLPEPVRSGVRLFERSISIPCP